MSSKKTILLNEQGHIYTMPVYPKCDERQLLCIDIYSGGGQDDFDCLEVMLDSKIGKLLFDAITNTKG